MGRLLIAAFVGLTDTLIDDYDIIDLLDRLAGYSVALLAADAAGILLGDAQANLRVVASTNEQTEWLELLQLEAGEGPCLEMALSPTLGVACGCRRHAEAVRIYADAAVRGLPDLGRLPVFAEGTWADTGPAAAP